MMKCQVCQQEKDVSAFTNRDAMSRVCDDCYDANRADYYASMSDPNDDARAYLAECDERAHRSDDARRVGGVNG